MFEKRVPHYELLSEDAMAIIEGGWRRLISEIGVEFLHDDAVELFRAAGQRIEGQVVHFDPDFVLALVESPEAGDEEVTEGEAHVYVDSAGARILDDAALDAHVEGTDVTFSLMPKPII